nr:hypothetical protein BDOA9_0156210 [Bradyrhizobium sp. DOA9]
MPSSGSASPDWSAAGPRNSVHGRRTTEAAGDILLVAEYCDDHHVCRHEGGSWERTMNHRGVEFTIAKTAIPGIWQWQFRIGDQIKTGKTETRIDLLAIRRVQLRIDRELKAIKRKTA